MFLLFFAGSTVLAYLSLRRLTASRWIALTASLLAFSSYYLLYYNDMVATENGLSLFGVLLTFHGMVVDSHFKCHTWWITISAGVAYPRHFRGVWL